MDKRGSFSPLDREALDSPSLYALVVWGRGGGMVCDVAGRTRRAAKLYSDFGVYVGILATNFIHRPSVESERHIRCLCIDRRIAKLASAAWFA